MKVTTIRCLAANYGFLQPDIFTMLSAAVSAGVFPCPTERRNGTLFLFSLLFYAWGEPVYVVLMLFSTALDYTCGQMVERHRGQRGAKIALLVSLCVNLGLLGLFKYSDFLIGTVNSLFGTAISQPNLPLPIGISFYTFQTMSYTIDVYRGEAKAQKNIINFGAYVTLFPQLIAGPIVRYQTVADELEHRECTADLFAEGVKRFACGIGKKVLLANNIGLLWEAASAQAAPTVLTAWLGVIAYGFQIYFDFSGYSDMAIGLGRMLGFRFLENFNYPFLADSITDFWRRWHISLSTWFRDYLYIPLGGNRKGTARMYLNLFIVFLVSGIWHGAGWKYIIYGLYYYIIMMLGMYAEPLIAKFFSALKIKRESAPLNIFRIFRTLILVIGGMMLFRADTVCDWIFMLKRIATDFGGGTFLKDALLCGMDKADFLITAIGAAVIFTVSLLQEKGIEIRGSIAQWALPARWAVYLALVLSVIIFGAYGIGYEAVDFIYGQF
mgnify:CR=1 FL=1